jgi:putative lipoic acid-binding regulatory protein
MNTNGNGQQNNRPDIFEGKEIEFPVTFQLKAVMIGTTDKENKQKLEKVFEENKVNYAFTEKKESSKGAYTSYTYEVTLNDKAQMDSMYTGLKEIEELKFAI